MLFDLLYDDGDMMSAIKNTYIMPSDVRGEEVVSFGYLCFLSFQRE